MRAAFGWSLDQYVFHGGYPGAAPLIGDTTRWARYVLDSLVETSIARDVLLLSRVDKPALLRRLFELACRYSGQVLSYTKMLGQLQDAGNVTTLAQHGAADDPDGFDARGGSGRHRVLGAAGGIRCRRTPGQRGRHGRLRMFYWRERNHEVDFVARVGRRLTAIEVKSSRVPTALPGMAAFARVFKPQRALLVGGDGISVEDFLSRPVLHWLAG